ncbi:unnamed protein product [Bemisia tabaci]|uniref:Solute carrier family 66 member 3 n=1 Tax=Bemisia tabaci TaxID=7038 RepID=A0A9P0EZ21_BEMTA|nr:PREDICTED: PQ-loop repeat-containing protein 3 [Bemisia tabaci]CAH0382821.1 unnamed protein product [Bemisia tabaci]
MDPLQLLSDTLSVITISMCCVLKVPQIMSLLRVKSSAGISLTSLGLELSSYTTTMLYNYVNGYALLSYLEYPIILLQEIVLIALVLNYSNKLNRSTFFLSLVYFSYLIGFATGIFPPKILMLIIPLCTPVSLSSKSIQLWEILRTHDVESLSVVSWLISALTNFARVFTIAMDSADRILLANVTLSTALSLCIMFSVMYFGKKKKD